MNLINRINLLVRMVHALERIATALEFQTLQSRSSNNKSLFSFESSGDPREGRVYAQTEEEFSALDEESQKHPDLVKQEEWLSQNGPR